MNKKVIVDYGNGRYGYSVIDGDKDFCQQMEQQLNWQDDLDFVPGVFDDHIDIYETSLYIIVETYRFISIEDTTEPLTDTMMPYHP